MLTLTGPGGTGKTRLALQLAAEVLPDFADGVYVVFLAPIREPELVVSAIAQALGDPRRGRAAAAGERVDFLRERQTLLGARQLRADAAAAPLVAELLAACPRLKVVVTSREVLHLYGEQEYSTPPLALPDPKQRGAADAEYVSHLAQSPAVALFVQRGAAAKPGFALTPANAAAVAEICIRLDGLPLALELAAAKLKLFPPQMLLARLQQRLALLTGGAQDLPARQRTLRDTIAWSYDLLAAGEQKFFRRLSVFVGGFTLEAAQAVGAADDLGMDFLDALAGLVDKSLVRQLGGRQRRGALWHVGDDPGVWAGAAHRQRRGGGGAPPTCPVLPGVGRGAGAGAKGAKPCGEPGAAWRGRSITCARRWRGARLTRSSTEVGLRLAGALAWFGLFGNHVGEARAVARSRNGASSAPRSRAPKRCGAQDDGHGPGRLTRSQSPNSRRASPLAQACVTTAGLLSPCATLDYASLLQGDVSGRTALWRGECIALAGGRQPMGSGSRASTFGLAHAIAGDQTTALRPLSGVSHGIQDSAG